MLTTTNVQDVFSGNGVTRAWTYTFDIMSTTGDEIQLWTESPTGVVAQVTTSYSIDVPSKTVTYPTLASLLAPLPTGWTLTLKRVLTLTQSVNLVNQGSLDSDTLEGALDKAIGVCQQLKSVIDTGIPGPTGPTGATGNLGTQGAINTLDEKTSLAANDIFVIEDSADTYTEKKIKQSSFVDTDATLAANSDLKLPSQKAVKTALDLKVIAPATNTANSVPQWNGANSKTLKDGLVVGTSANNLVQLDGSGKLPALDGSQLIDVLGTPTIFTKFGGDGSDGAMSVDGETVNWDSSPKQFTTLDIEDDGIVNLSDKVLIIGVSGDCHIHGSMVATGAGMDGGIGVVSDAVGSYHGANSAGKTFYGGTTHETFAIFAQTSVPFSMSGAGGGGGGNAATKGGDGGGAGGNGGNGKANDGNNGGTTDTFKSNSLSNENLFNFLSVNCGAGGGGGYGSDGDQNPGDGGDGGGVIYIEVAGALVYDGALTSNGENGETGTGVAGGGGGGGGGTIIIRAKTITTNTGTTSVAGGTGGGGTKSGGNGAAGYSSITEVL
jgi:hypothetical protein